MLVLINDTDWELMGELDAPLEEGDQVTLISTLHGELHLQTMGINPVHFGD